MVRLLLIIGDAMHYSASVKGLCQKTAKISCKMVQSDAISHFNLYWGTFGTTLGIRGDIVKALGIAALLSTSGAIWRLQINKFQFQQEYVLWNAVSVPFLRKLLHSVY